MDNWARYYQAGAGGMISAAVLSLLVIPVVYLLWKKMVLRASGPEVR